MYYDIAKHPKYEYVIYCRVSNARPYIIPRIFSSMREVLSFIEEIEDKHKRQHSSYFIDNFFYKNKHSANENGTYYKVIRRKVNDWQEIPEYENDGKVVSIESAKKLRK